jgi:hypothetical protein
MTQPIIAHQPNCKVSILQIGSDRQTWEPKVKEAAARLLLDRHFTQIGTVYYRLIVPLKVVGGQKVKTADRVEVLEAPDFPQLNGLFTVTLAMIDTEALNLELVVTKL